MGRVTDQMAVRTPDQLAGVGWSPRRAADFLGVTVDHVSSLCRRGQLIAVMDRRRWYIDPGSVRSYLRRTQGPYSGGG